MRISQYLFIILIVSGSHCFSQVTAQDVGTEVITEFKIFRPLITSDQEDSLEEDACYTIIHTLGGRRAIQKTDCMGHIIDKKLYLVDYIDLKEAIMPYGDVKLGGEIQLKEKSFTFAEKDCVRVIGINEGLNLYKIKKINCDGTLSSDTEEYDTSTKFLHKDAQILKPVVLKIKRDLSIFNSTNPEYKKGECIEIIGSDDKGKYFKKTDCNGKLTNTEEEHYLKNEDLKELLIPKSDVKVTKSLQILNESENLNISECVRAVGVNENFNLFSVLKTNCKGAVIGDKKYRISMTWFKEGVEETGITPKGKTTAIIEDDYEVKDKGAPRPQPVVTNPEVYHYDKDDYKKVIPGKDQLFVNVPVTSLFKRPGLTWKDCEENNLNRKKNCIDAWPKKGENLTLKDIKIFEIDDPYTGLKRNQLFYQVDYKVGEKVMTGWISSEFASRENPEVYKKIKIIIPKKGLKKKEPKTCPLIGQHEVPKEIEDLIDLEVDDNADIEDLGLDDIVEQLKERREGKQLVGRCYNPPSRYVKGEKTVFDNSIGSGWTNNNLPKVEYIKIKNGKGEKKNIEKKDMIAIDALARTLYGEMAKCHVYGRGYFFGVAAVIANRARATDHEDGSFFAGRKNYQHNITHVTIKNAQFSVWNKSYKNEINHGLKHVLCPPAEKDKNMWTGGKPSKKERKIWDDALKVASMAVLYPKQFCQYTKNVKGFYYTSTIDFKGPYEEVKDPEVDGMKLSRNSCIRFWDVKKKSGSYNTEQKYKRRLSCDKL